MNNFSLKVDLKSRRSRPSIQANEWLVIVFASLTLGFTAWGLAGVVVWAVHVMLAGGMLTLVFALFSNSKSHSTFSCKKRYKWEKSNISRLLRWMPFWFSLLFLFYLTIQAFNPSITVVRGDGGWWVEEMTPSLAGWLPASVQSDYQPMNAFRVLEWFTASFALMWGIWAGVTRRQSALIILWFLILNGSAMAMVGILQHLSDTDKVLWTFSSSNRHFWGSFFYRNQGAAFLNLILIGAGALYFYHVKRSAKGGKTIGPHFLLFLLVFLNASSVSLALSRGAILFLAVLLMTFLVLSFIHKVVIFFQNRTPWIESIVTGTLLIIGLLLMTIQVDRNAIKERFGDIGATVGNFETDTRVISSKATMQMFQARLWFGWGAGSFRYIFPIYQKNYPEIFFGHFHKGTSTWRGRKIYHYAHNDLLQFLAEYGFIGCSFLILTCFTIMIPFFKFSFESLFLLVGFGCILAHASIEFIFNSPAYWVAMVGLFVSFSKLTVLNIQRRESNVSHP